MRTTLSLVLMTAALLNLGSGCNLADVADLVDGLAGLDTTTVVLENDGAFPVVVELWFGDDQNALRAVLTEFGEMRNFTILAGGSASFSQDCDDLQALVIADADLSLFGGFGPDTNTEVFRDGSDFGCGDTITIRFSHADVVIPTSLTVTFSAD